jgi:hypothetical protein
MVDGSGHKLHQSLTAILPVFPENREISNKNSELVELKARITL